jgi:hypothetical protein
MSAYSTGSISLVCDTNQIIGSGTLFLTNVKVGALLMVPGLSTIFQIAAVIDDLTLHAIETIPGPSGNTMSGLTYYVADQFTPIIGIPLPTRGVINMQALINRGVLLLDNEMPV